MLPPLLKKELEKHPKLQSIFKLHSKNKSELTRTAFNLIATEINKEITRIVLRNPELIFSHIIIGKVKLESLLEEKKLKDDKDFLDYLEELSPFRSFHWISGKALQSYWNEGSPKNIKTNILLTFLEIPFNKWKDYYTNESEEIQDIAQNTKQMLNAIHSKQVAISELNESILKKYYLGNYYLYYQKTDNTQTLIKTPFTIYDNGRAGICVRSVSEGHKYEGKVIGILDGCLYMNCNNLEFEEMEQYIFNIGLETKPEVIFGVSVTVTVKSRQPIAIRNVLVKQKTEDPHFHLIEEIEIPLNKKTTVKQSNTTDKKIFDYFISTPKNNLITVQQCCSINDLP